MGVGKKGAKSYGGGSEKGALLAQGARRVTRSPVRAASVAEPSAATERGGGPSLFPNSAQGERLAFSGGGASGPPGPAVGVADKSLASSVGGSEDPRKLEPGLTVDEGGRVVDIEREDGSTPLAAHNASCLSDPDPDSTPSDRIAGGNSPCRSPRKNGRPITRSSILDACGTLSHDLDIDACRPWSRKTAKNPAHFLPNKSELSANREPPMLVPLTHSSPRFSAQTPPFPTYAAVVKQSALSSASPALVKGRRRAKRKSEGVVAENSGYEGGSSSSVTSSGAGGRSEEVLGKGPRPSRPSRTTWRRRSIRYARTCC